MPRLDESLSYVRDRVSECAKSGRPVLVTTHIDCDGLVAGSIMARALEREGARFAVRTAREMGAPLVSELKGEGRAFHVITDLGGGFAAKLDEELGDGWVVLDHHQIPDSEMDDPRVVNAWKYGIDGGSGVCAGGMAYLAAAAMDDANGALSAAAIVSALGDRQDGGERKSLAGKNFEIAEAAKGLGLVEMDLDLLLVGRETRPLADALAFTSQPFIEGLTWNRGACLAMLDSAGVRLKEGGRWRVPAELDGEEKKQVIEAVARFASGRDATGMMAEMIGYTYTFPGEDGRSFLRDGREYATMLNSCGRIGRSGVGIAVCMGDRDAALREAEGILVEYRSMIREYMGILGSQRWRTSESGRCVMVNGEDVVPETMTGTISSLIAGSPRNAGKIVILRTKAGGSDVKFSSRKSFGCKSGVNLSRLMREGAERFDGMGGGHDAAAGAKITRDKLDDFLRYLDAGVAGVQDSAEA